MELAFGLFSCQFCCSFECCGCQHIVEFHLMTFLCGTKFPSYSWLEIGYCRKKWRVHLHFNFNRCFLCCCQLFVKFHLMTFPCGTKFPQSWLEIAGGRKKWKVHFHKRSQSVIADWQVEKSLACDTLKDERKSFST